MYVMITDACFRLIKSPGRKHPFPSRRVPAWSMSIRRPVCAPGDQPDGARDVLSSGVAVQRRSLDVAQFSSCSVWLVCMYVMITDARFRRIKGPGRQHPFLSCLVAAWSIRGHVCVLGDQPDGAKDVLSPGVAAQRRSLDVARFSSSLNVLSPGVAAQRRSLDATRFSSSHPARFRLTRTLSPHGSPSTGAGAVHAPGECNVNSDSTSTQLTMSCLPLLKVAPVIPSPSIPPAYPSSPPDTDEASQVASTFPTSSTIWLVCMYVCNNH